MAAMSLLGLLMFICSLAIAEAQIGLCHGGGTNVSSEKEVVSIFKQNNIKIMRLYDPNPATLEALRGSDIELTLGVPNADLESVSASQANANSWVAKNVGNYANDVKFRYIAIGNEVYPSHDQNAQYAPFVLPAMQNIQTAIASAGLGDGVKVSIATDPRVLAEVPTFPPSKGSFRTEVREFLEPVIGFLVKNQAPLLMNLHPYYMYFGNTAGIALDSAIFGTSSNGVIAQDGQLSYTNLFDVTLDAVYAALEKAGGGSVQVVAAESGWPTEGGPGATIENARTYNSNLIKHVRGGSPAKPGKEIETYLYSMFDGNQSWYPEFSNHWGIFDWNKQPKYPLNFV